jgi:lipopolysaccharide export system protein LptC
MRQAQEGQAPLQMQGVRVRIFDQGQRLQAIEGVKMQRGDLSMQGAAMDWDSNSRVLTMHGAVRTVVMP